MGNSHCRDQVLLQSKWTEDHDKNRSTSQITLSCIEEESLTYGLGDHIIIKSSTDHHALGQFIVEEVLSRKAFVVKPVESSAGDLSSCKELVVSGRAVVQKVKSTQTIHHQPLLLQQLNPRFNPSNGCLSSKQDRALSLVLFSAIKTYYMLFTSGSFDLSRETEREEIFRAMIEGELSLLGVKDPYLPIKKGGKVGADWMNYVIKRFAKGCRGKCPATISAIGSILSQEAIKGITQMYSPVSQWLLFESLDSQHVDDDTSPPEETIVSEAQRVYGKEIAQELSSLRVFVVGAGAIGCELLKNFALLGVGTGQSREVDDLSDGESLWQRNGLSRGGIMLTDMDSIERSNLNRQLLFRFDRQHLRLTTLYPHGRDEPLHFTSLHCTSLHCISGRDTLASRSPQSPLKKSLRSILTCGSTLCTQRSALTLKICSTTPSGDTRISSSTRSTMSTPGNTWTRSVNGINCS